MTNKFSDQMGGFITLRLRGQGQEKIINMALARGIYIWDIKRQDDSILLKVRESGYEAFKSIADEQNHDLEVLKREGLPFFKTIMKRRMGLLAGALIFILGLYILSSFVWFVEVTGNERVERNRILISAAREGVYVGAGKWTFSRIAVEEAMLRELNELAYIQCNISGVKATIKVVEKILPAESITEPCHVVAKRDGVVENVLVLKGQAHVKSGDVVARGDILISGLVLPTIPDAMEGFSAKPPEPYEVRARGEVKARTWYEGYGECVRKLEEKIATGNTFTKLYLITPWTELLVKGHRDVPFVLYDENHKEWSTARGKWGIRQVVLQEQAVKTTEYTEAQAVEAARGQAMLNLRANMGASLEIKESHLSLLSRPSDSIVRLKISAETIEDIGVAQLIERAEISN